MPTRTVTSSDLLARASAAWLDVALASVALLVGAASLTYPFGRDQGLYYYVGREWVLRGSVPYRDVFDHKPPGLYVVHALCVALFGEKLWGIRVAELVGMLAIGAAAGALATPRGERIMPGLRGLASLLFSVTYFGLLDFKETAEGELWIALSILVGCAALTRLQRDWTGYAVAGATSAVAMLIKPSAAVLILVTVALAAGRATAARPWRAPALFHAFGALVGGAAVVLVPLLGYFAVRSALGPMTDIVVRANRYYVLQESGISGVGALVDGLTSYLGWYWPILSFYALAWLAAVALAVTRRDRPRARLQVVASALCLAGCASVVLQGKFFPGHWSVMCALLACAGTTSAATLAGGGGGDARPWMPAATLLSMAGLALAAHRISDQYERHRTSSLGALALMRGQLRREEYLTHFVEHGLGGPARDNEDCAAWMRERTNPDDPIAVRGFQPQIYATAQRRYRGRFFWTTFIVAPTRSYRRDAWLAEDRRVLEAHPPRYVVTLRAIEEGPDAPSTFEGLGYAATHACGDLVVMEATTRTSPEDGRL